MRKLLLLCALILTTWSLQAQIAIEEAKTQEMGSTVTVQGIMTSGSELGSVRYIQDATAGIAIYNPDMNGDVAVGDEVLITGQLTEYNSLLEIVDEGDFSYEVISSGNDLPAPLEVTIADGFLEANEGRLIQVAGITFTESGEFEGNTNYLVADDTAEGQLRVANGTDIPGEDIPTEAITAIGILGQFSSGNPDAGYQLLPRSGVDLGIEVVVDPPGELITIAEAREQATGTVTVQGIVTTGGEFGNVRYFQDETAGISVFDFDLAEEVSLGDEILITGQLTEYNSLLQIVDDGDFSYEIISTGNDVEPFTTSIDFGFNESFEGQLITVPDAFFAESGSFEASTNYEINDDSGSGAVRINFGTDIAGLDIPEDAVDVTGILGQYDTGDGTSGYQLLPRSSADIGEDVVIVDPPGDLITIAEARDLPNNSTVVVRGIVINGSELGAIRYIYDGTAGIGVYDFAMSTEVEIGDSLQVTGQLTQYNNLLEIVDDGEFDFTVLNSGNPLPEPTTLVAGLAYSEEYEGQLLRIENVNFTEGGNFSVSSSNYTVNNGIANFTVRVNGTTDIGGTPIPSETMNMVGIMSQYSPEEPEFGYQFLPRSLADFEFVGNPPVFTSTLEQDNLTTTGFDVSFTTANPGTTVVNYGLSPELELGTLSDDELVNDHTISISDLEPGQVYYVQATSVGATGDVSQSSIQAMATVSLSSGVIDVFFNRSVDESLATDEIAKFLPYGLADTLIWYIGQATETIDMTIYTIDNENGIIDALQEAHDNGITCRFVCDSSVDGAEYSALPGDQKIRRPSTMFGIQHNKFLVIDADSEDPDKPLVWTGATNFSDNQLNIDPNNVVVVQDQSLARSYKLEFEEMLGDVWGEDKTENTPRDFLIGGVPVELFMSPSDPTNPAIRRVIDSADHELIFGIMAFTRYDIAYEIEEEVEEGVAVYGIMNTNSADSEEPYNILIDDMGEENLLVNDANIFHHKYAIVDPNNLDSDPTVLTGSHNWTTSAQVRNDENTLIIHDATIANIFYQEFAQRFQELFGWFMAVDEVNNQWAIKAYPNPANDLLHIDLINTTGDIKLSIMDLAGRTVYSQNIQNGGISTLDVNTNNLAPGMYILNINGQSEKIQIAR